MEKEVENYYKKVENYYNATGKLKQYPAKKPLRVIVLGRIAEQFDKVKKYNEKQVNEIIKDQIEFSDYELIRRELFQYKILNRLRDGSEYWLNSNWMELYREYYE